MPSQQMRDMDQVELLRKTEELDITWTGLDSGERLAYCSLLADSLLSELTQETPTTTQSTNLPPIYQFQKAK
jgi:hypothetical protein